MRVKILKAITVTAVIMLILSVCAIDSNSYIPTVIAFICEGWLALMTYANREWLEKYYD